MPFYHQLAIRDEASSMDLVANVWYDGMKHPTIIGKAPWKGDDLEITTQMDWTEQPKTAAANAALSAAQKWQNLRRYGYLAEQEKSAGKKYAKDLKVMYDGVNNERMTDLSASLAGIGDISNGVEWGASLGSSFAPIAGTIVGGLIGGMLGYTKGYLKDMLDTKFQQSWLPKIAEKATETYDKYIAKDYVGLSLSSQEVMLDLTSFYKQYAGSTTTVGIPQPTFIFANEGDPTRYVASVCQMLRFILPSNDKTHWSNGEKVEGFTASERAPNDFQQPQEGKDYSHIKGDFDLRCGKIWFRHLIPTGVTIRRSADCSYVSRLESSYMPTMALPFDSEMMNKIVNSESFKTKKLPSTFGHQTWSPKEEAGKVSAENPLYLPNIISISVSLAPAIAYLPEDTLQLLFGSEKGK